MITQKKYLNLIALLVALITGVMFLPGLSNADVTVIDSHYFGEVVVGESSDPVTLGIDTNGDRVFITELTLEKDCGFLISPKVPPEILAIPGQITITYSPLSPGYCQTTLSIHPNVGNPAYVDLSGTGLPDSTQNITIQGILDFFDSCVAAADGSLEGYVPDKSDKKRSADKTTKGNGSDKLAENRVNALRNMIETAGHLIDSGKIDEACGQLKAAYKKMDGLNTPGSSTDFVTGEAVSKLSTMVQKLMDTLECK